MESPEFMEKACFDKRSFLTIGEVITEGSNSLVLKYCLLAYMAACWGGVGKNAVPFSLWAFE